VRSAHLVSHLDYDWQLPLVGPLLQRLAEQWRLTRYDGRGTGLSDRNVADISFDTFLKDLEAVIDSLEVEHFSLLGMSAGAATAVAYAARHPQRVSKLVLFGGYALGRNKRTSPQSANEAQAFYTMLRGGWGDVNSPFWRAFNSFFLPNGTPEQFKWLMDYHRTAAAVEDSIKIRMALDDIDVLDLASMISVPTIVFHCSNDKLVPFEQGRLLAASIRGSKFVALDSENHVLLPQEPAWAKFVSDVEAFLSDEA
jgi:pimeloyl-ACP methyl ester carboxylesterase